MIITAGSELASGHGLRRAVGEALNIRRDCALSRWAGVPEVQAPRTMRFGRTPQSPALPFAVRALRQAVTALWGVNSKQRATAARVAVSWI